ncbi:MAG: Flp family type IVb pilin [Asticcacaulis sp.]
MRIFTRFLKNESGATAIEYGLIVAFVFLAITAALYSYRDSFTTLYQYLADSVSTAAEQH